MNAWIGPILIQFGYPLRLIQRREVSPEKLLLLRRDGWTQRVLAYPQPDEVGIHLKRLHDLLCQGHWIQHVADYADRGTGLRGLYLGRQVRCGRVPWVLGRLTGAPLVPVLVLVDERMRARMHIGTPIILGETPSGNGALEAAFQTYLRFLESHIREVPWNLSPSHLRQICFADCGGPGSFVRSP
ncbi:MAG: hypothetical protein NTW87_04610 [Planctomycetota bacterium]|nr:hypothetical protein [Planctomycetota bacterium]